MTNTANETNTIKSIRLNATKREDIVEKVMEKWDETNPAPEEKISRVEAANYFYRKKVSEKLENELKEVKKKYGFENPSTDMRVIVNGQHRRFPFYPSNCGVYSEQSKYAKLFPNGNGYDAETVTIPDTDKVICTLEKQEDKKREHDSKRFAMEKQVTQIIESVNTTKQLVETWPEIIDFIPQYQQDPSKGIQLPATLKDELNASIGVK